MSGLRKPELIVLLSALVLLFGVEFWLLQMAAHQRSTEKYGLWGNYGLLASQTRLQTAINAAVLLSKSPLINKPISTTGLLTLFDSIKKNSSDQFSDSALITQISNAERGAFEQNIRRPIIELRNDKPQYNRIQSRYYPIFQAVASPNSLLQPGLNIASLPAGNRALTQAQNTGQPALLTYRDAQQANRLALLVALTHHPNKLLLLNLNLKHLLNPALPYAGVWQDQFRITLWGIPNGQQPLLIMDSAPNQQRDTHAPDASSSTTLGGLTLILSAYRLETTNPWQLDPLNTRIFWLSLCWAIFLLFGVCHLISRRNLTQQKLIELNARLRADNRHLDQKIIAYGHLQQVRTGSEMRQHAILQASSDAILLANHLGNITDINPAAARLIRQAPSALTGMNVGMLFPELQVPADQLFSESAVVSQYIGKTFESLLKHPDLNQQAVELSLSQVRLPEDQFFLLVCRDISVRKEQEAALIHLKNSLVEQVKTQQQQLAALLDASPMAMAYIVERQIKQVNHAFLELFEQVEERVIDFSTRQFYKSDEQYEHIGRMVYHQLINGQVVTVEIHLKTGRDNLFWCRLYGKAVNPDVPALGAIWIYQNFSSEREAEVALRRAKALAEESSKTKTEFLANMSHELRTPMHAILGFAEMGAAKAEHDKLEKIQQYFNRISSSGSRLLVLLNDLLDLAKMEVGRMEYSLQQNDVAKLLTEVCEELSGMAYGRGIHIELCCGATKPLMATFDQLRIGQVMRNLLTNAIKFSPNNSNIQVKAGLKQQAYTPFIFIQVIDQGPGIPNDELEAIFDKFTQSNSTKTGAGGTGLGLAICREIMHAHHGEITAANAEGGGALFTCYFPAHPASKEE